MSVKALDLKVCTVFSDGIIDEVYERMWALFHGFSKFNNKTKLQQVKTFELF